MRPPSFPLFPSVQGFSVVSSAFIPPLTLARKKGDCNRLGPAKERSQRSSKRARQATVRAPHLVGHHLITNPQAAKLHQSHARADLKSSLSQPTSQNWNCSLREPPLLICTRRHLSQPQQARAAPRSPRPTSKAGLRPALQNAAATDSACRRVKDVRDQLRPTRRRQQGKPASVSVRGHG